MPDWQIRRAGPEDTDEVLQAEVFDGPAQRDYVLRFLGTPEAPDPRNLMLVAEIGGRIEGFVTAVLLDHPDKPLTLFINELGVNEAYRRKRIGQALLEATRAEGRARGCKETWVATEGDNLPALALYRSAQGEETGDIVMFAWKEPAPG